MIEDGGKKIYSQKRLRLIRLSLKRNEHVRFYSWANDRYITKDNFPDNLNPSATISSSFYDIIAFFMLLLEILALRNLGISVHARNNVLVFFKKMLCRISSTSLIHIWRTFLSFS